MADASPLLANTDLSNRGACLFGAGFIVACDQASQLGLGSVTGLQNYVRHYRGGRDLTTKSRNAMVIDLFGLTESEVRQRFPAAYQWVLDRVKPERDHNNRASGCENWWIFGETNPKMRRQLRELPRYVATPATSKHRFFCFINAEILPDDSLCIVTSDDAWILGTLSSRIHVIWTLSSGGRLGVGGRPSLQQFLVLQ